MARWTNEDRTPLALLRVNAGYTMAEAAVSMKLGIVTLSRYENGQTDLPFGIGEQMASLYKVQFEDIHQAVLATKKMTGANITGRISKLRRNKA